MRTTRGETQTSVGRGKGERGRPVDFFFFVDPAPPPALRHLPAAFRSRVPLHRPTLLLLPRCSSHHTAPPHDAAPPHRTAPPHLTAPPHHTALPHHTAPPYLAASPLRAVPSLRAFPPRPLPPAPHPDCTLSCAPVRTLHSRTNGSAPHTLSPFSFLFSHAPQPPHHGPLHRVFSFRRPPLRLSFLALARGLRFSPRQADDEEGSPDAPCRPAAPSSQRSAPSPRDWAPGSRRPPSVAWSPWGLRVSVARRRRPSIFNARQM